MTQRFSNVGAKSLLLKSLPMDYHLDILLESSCKNYDLQTEVNSEIDKVLIPNIETIITNNNIKFDKNDKEICNSLSLFISMKGFENTENTDNFTDKLLQEYEELALGKNVNDNLEDFQGDECLGFNTPKDLMSTEDDIKEEAKNIFENLELVEKNECLSNPPNTIIDLTYKIETTNKFGEGNTTFFKELTSKNFKNHSITTKPKKDVKLIVKKEKKEETLFIFTKEACINKEEVYYDKMLKRTNKKKDKQNKKTKYIMKTPEYYNFQQEYILKYWWDFGFYKLKGGQGFQYSDENIENQIFNDDRPIKDKTMNDLEKLYKKYDVKTLKEKMWEIYKSENDSKKEFNQVINEFNNINNDQINFSVSTCFVCLLHLANEKTLLLESVEDNIMILSNN